MWDKYDKVCYQLRKFVNLIYYKHTNSFIWSCKKIFWLEYKFKGILTVTIKLQSE